ncbi:MAG: hypothetical protein E3J64_06905 [Anaerolineales bacterium]|nr:MAG: hypothetical protein E3J64_06905 [Anaerolineales bacterium]
MNSTGKRFLWVSVYSTAAAFVEAVVVVYIRTLLNVTAGYPPLGSLLASLEPYARIEMWREVATIVMLLAVGWMAGQRRSDRLAYGLFAFALWDIWYYVWLKALIGWPEALLESDLLFMIPLPWWGPVLSPVLVAVLICVNAVLAKVRMDQGRRLGFTPARAGAIVLGALVAFYTFTSDALRVLLDGQLDWDKLRPEPFNWPLFLAALALMAVPSLAATWPGRRPEPKPQ